MSGMFGTQGKQKQNAAPVLNVQGSTYGAAVPIVYGMNRVAGNMIWYSDFKQILQSTGGQSGKGGMVGGGGKGGGSQSYIYYASFMVGICEGQITGVNTVWSTKQITNLSLLGGALFTGALGQAPWGYLTTNHPTQADGYSKLAYAAFPNMQLGTSAETPQLNFEVKGLLYGTGGSKGDAAADQVISDFLARCNFPTAYIGSFSTFATYCQAMGFFISPIADQQRIAMDYLKEWMDTLNSEFVWSNGVLTIVPYGDTVISANGVTYTPNLTPIYSLMDDDYIVHGDEDPVTVERQDLADAYNVMPVEYTNRADQYNLENYKAEDPAHIDQYGVRIGSSLPAHHVCDPNIAQTMIYLKLWRSIYIEKGNIYTFKLPWNFILLDPMDLIAINDNNLGLVNKLVRIKKIEEDEEGVLSFTCEDMPGGIASPALYSTQGTVRYIPNYNSSGGSINTPVFFEAPLQFVQSNDVEIDVAVSGNPTTWGGCQIWVSTDGTTYQNIGQINGSARQGSLTASLANYSSVGIDYTNTLSIDMTESGGSFNNAASNADAISYNTLCYVDGELISFGNDILTSTYKYDLTYLNRGCYGSTISSHASGSNFVRFDSAVFRYSIDQTRVGKTLYFKFPSFNVYGGGLQNLADISAYTYVVIGSALLTAPSDPTHLTTNYFGDIAQLNWTFVSDIRTPIYYEIRKGTTFGSGQYVGRTTQTGFRVLGSGTYWVAALYITPLGVNVYSSSPPSIFISTPTIVQNVLATYDEYATGWTGTKTNCSVVSTNLVTTAGVTSATYQAPSGHNISSNYRVSARVTMNWYVSAVNAASDVVLITDITAVTDMTFAAVQGKVITQPQVSTDGGATWQNWEPGVYTYTTIGFRLVMTISDTTYQASISAFSFEVDVDNLTQTANVNTSASSVINVTFPLTYNVAPAVTLTILNATAGDDAVITSVTTGGFSLEVLNSGSKVVRTVTYNAIGY